MLVGEMGIVLHEHRQSHSFAMPDTGPPSMNIPQLIMAEISLLTKLQISMTSLSFQDVRFNGEMMIVSLQVRRGQIKYFAFLI